MVAMAAKHLGLPGEYRAEGTIVVSSFRGSKETFHTVWINTGGQVHTAVHDGLVLGSVKIYNSVSQEVGP